MRAWLLLLAVLATFQTIVQVASTEDISTRFIAAIAPTTTTATAIHNTNTKATATTTALAKAFKPFNELLLHNNNNSSDSDNDSDNNNNKNKKKQKQSAEFKVQFNEVHKTTTTITRTDQLENSKNSKNQIHNNKHHKHNKLTNNKHKSNKQSKMAIKELNKKSTKTRESPAQSAITDVFRLAPPATAAASPTSESGSSNNITSNTATSSNKFDSSSETAVLGEFEVPGIGDAIIVEDEPATYSNKEIIKDKAKPDPSTLVEIENSLLSLFNMKRPPKIDRSKIIIPEAMKKLYAQIMGHEIDSVNIPRPGLLTKSANTVRSFTHKGRLRHKAYMAIIIINRDHRLEHLKRSTLYCNTVLSLLSLLTKDASVVCQKYFAITRNKPTV